MKPPTSKQLLNTKGNVLLQPGTSSTDKQTSKTKKKKGENKQAQIPTSVFAAGIY